MPETLQDELCSYRHQLSLDYNKLAACPSNAILAMASGVIKGNPSGYCPPVFHTDAAAAVDLKKAAPNCLGIKGVPTKDLCNYDPDKWIGIRCYSKFYREIWYNRVYRIRLKNCGVESLPDSIENLTYVQDFDLLNNSITSLPASIGKMQALSSLWLYGNFVVSLPPEIGNLRRLSKLYIIGNVLEDLPSELANLAHMEFFKAAHNPFSKLRNQKLKTILAGMDSAVSKNGQMTQFDLAYSSRPANPAYTQVADSDNDGCQYCCTVGQSSCIFVLSAYTKHSLGGIFAAVSFGGLKFSVSLDAQKRCACFYGKDKTKKTGCVGDGCYAVTNYRGGAASKVKDNHDGTYVHCHCAATVEQPRGNAQAVVQQRRKVHQEQRVYQPDHAYRAANRVRRQDQHST